MFCPACSAYLTEKDLIKTAVKYAPGNVPIEYDARCPNCSVEMGRVSWGQLTANPNIGKPAPASQPEEQNAKPAMPGNGANKQKTCPHCGKDLPEGF